MAVIKDLPLAFVFTVDVTDADPDKAREVAEAFAKLAITIADARGGRGRSTPLRPYRHGGDRIVGWRFNHTVEGDEELVTFVRLRLQAAASEDGRGCNFAIHEPWVCASPFTNPDELHGKLELGN